LCELEIKSIKNKSEYLFHYPLPLSLHLFSWVCQGRERREREGEGGKGEMRGYEEERERGKGERQCLNMFSFMFCVSSFISCLFVAFLMFLHVSWYCFSICVS
jgi:hypothetical protein